MEGGLVLRAGGLCGESTPYLLITSTPSATQNGFVYKNTILYFDESAYILFWTGSECALLLTYFIK